MDHTTEKEEIHLRVNEEPRASSSASELGDISENTQVPSPSGTSQGRNSPPMTTDTREVHEVSEKGGVVKGLFRELVELVVVTLLLLIAIRWAIGEARYIPSASME